MEEKESTEQVSVVPRVAVRKKGSRPAERREVRVVVRRSEVRA